MKKVSTKKVGKKKPNLSPEKRTPTAAKRLASKNGVREWMLRLYIAGMSATAREALKNLETICEEHLGGRYKIEVVDLLKRPQLASGDQIIAVPTLVRQLPPPMKKIIGDLSNKERVLIGLDVRPFQPQRARKT